MPGTKYDQGKPPLALLSKIALLEVGRVLAHGAEKYAADNWRGGLGHRRLISAALRHILAWNEGEDLDEETGLSHLAHAMCCLMFAIEEHALRPEYDDRWYHHDAQASPERDFDTGGSYDSATDADVYPGEFQLRLFSDDHNSYL